VRVKYFASANSPASRGVVIGAVEDLTVTNADVVVVRRHHDVLPGVREPLMKPTTLTPLRSAC
jgi:hypothetical protein